MLDNNSGTTGIKNLASWCLNKLNTATPEIAERSGSGSGRSQVREEVKREMNAGPRSCGRLTRRWVYHGWSPWRARFEVSTLYITLLRGVTMRGCERGCLKRDNREGAVEGE